MSVTRARSLDADTLPQRSRLRLTPGARPHAPADAQGDLASLVREWIHLSERLDSRSAPTTNVADDSLFRFVTGRLRERAEMSRQADDPLTHRFVTWEVEWIEHAWHGLADRATGHREMEQYLLRTAGRYRRHPDFDVAWRQPPVS